MGEHRKKQRYRRVVVAAVAVSAVGVPSIAMACGEWPGGAADRPVDARNAAAQSRYADYGQRYWHGDGGIAPSWLPSQTPSTSAPSATTPAATAPSAPAATPQKPKHKHKHKHRHLRKHTVTVSPSAPRPTASTPRSTPKPAATAPRSTPRPTAPAATATAPSTPAPTASATATASGVVARVVELVNAERGKVGCSPLNLNATLTKAAQEHSQDMAAHQNMSHTGSDGSSPGDRITGAGYSWSSYGENVAYGYSTPEEVMAGWMSSPGHRANILNCAFKEIGVGLAQPGSYWTQDFGAAR
ncbi:CAP domain-containing protein [Streptomyces sp. NPDC002250]|uniref:CAP domain-containing protein n=1 Tax=Streptomyces sp. NPDC002250 TaxID=3364641 RepID=UPI00369B1B26